MPKILWRTFLIANREGGGGILGNEKPGIPWPIAGPQFRVLGGICCDCFQMKNKRKLSPS